MWNELWGTMVWGGVGVPVPALSVVGLGCLGLGLLLGARAAQGRPIPKPVSILLVVGLAAVPVLAVGDVTLPHLFSNGTVADADEVNANFASIQQDFARYTISTLGANDFGDSVPIPVSVTNQLCGDGDGCSVRLSMVDWSPSFPGQHASTAEFLFFVDPVTGHFRSSDDVSGIDGDGATGNIVNIFNQCYLTDSVFQDFSAQGDPGPGFALLHWNAYSTPALQCRLTLTD